jgi:hypothetical protein
MAICDVESTTANMFVPEMLQLPGNSPMSAPERDERRQHTGSTLSVVPDSPALLMNSARRVRLPYVCSGVFICIRDVVKIHSSI